MFNSASTYTQKTIHMIIRITWNLNKCKRSDGKIKYYRYIKNNEITFIMFRLHATRLKTNCNIFSRIILISKCNCRITSAKPSRKQHKIDETRCCKICMHGMCVISMISAQPKGIHRNHKRALDTLDTSSSIFSNKFVI